MSNKTPITVARGDGIGPEIMDATLRILDAAGAALAIEEIKVGEDVYKSGIASGIPDSAWESLRRTKVLLKGPITTPQGGGYKSLNVTMRKALGLYANVRPCVSYAPYVDTKHPNMDLVIVRENEEDLYGGIEYRQSQDVMASLKLISRQGSERIARYAFEYARANNRKKITCMTKDNIMKLTDGLFHRMFDEVGKDYPDIEQNHMIIDIGAAKIAAQPHMFDVILTPNLYGDIVSDIAAEITGSVGLGGSSNIGTHCAMFEAIHGSAPDIAGKGMANPSGVLLGAVMMLVHIGQPDVANRIHNAWLRTIEDGIHTGDIFRSGLSTERVGTDGFTKALIERIGKMPEKMKAANYNDVAAGGMVLPPLRERVEQEKIRVGVDININWTDSADALASKVLPCIVDGLDLKLISNRGVKVWPNAQPGIFCVDNWRLRIMDKDGGHIKTSQIIDLLDRLNKADLNFTKAVMLHTFDGEPGFSAAAG
ncbi:MAG: NADP-dependent isocitrate dehydrogenase [Alphaproteobacteria bacterium]|nr:NADP-dependent isocitrate dehydrogenase [Alphaproteobacteria bacterium]